MKREARIDSEGNVALFEIYGDAGQITIDEFRPVQTVKLSESELKTVRGSMATHDISFDEVHNKIKIGKRKPKV